MPSLIVRRLRSIPQSIPGDAILTDHPVRLGRGRVDYRRESSKIEPDPSDLCSANYTSNYCETNCKQIGSLPARIDRSVA